MSVPLGQVCNDLACPFFQVGYAKNCFVEEHTYKPNGEIDPSICLACPTTRAPQKITKKLTSGFEVCDQCFAHYEPDLKKAEAKKDKNCPQCGKPFGLGFGGFCSDKCLDVRMNHFTKEKQGAKN